MVSVPGRRALLAVWVLAAVVSGALLFAAGRLEGPLDDPDQAEQRVGFLDEGPFADRRVGCHGWSACGRSGDRCGVPSAGSDPDPTGNTREVMTILS